MQGQVETVNRQAVLLDGLEICLQSPQLGDCWGWEQGHFANLRANRTDMAGNLIHLLHIAADRGVEILRKHDLLDLGYIPRADPIFNLVWDLGSSLPMAKVQDKHGHIAATCLISLLAALAPTWRSNPKKKVGKMEKLVFSRTKIKSSYETYDAQCLQRQANRSMGHGPQIQSIISFIFIYLYCILYTNIINIIIYIYMISSNLVDTDQNIYHISRIDWMGMEPRKLSDKNKTTRVPRR